MNLFQHVLSILVTFTSLYGLNAAQASYLLHANATKVPVVLGVMSRCPDAILCESVFDHVLKEIGPKMTMELTFIARLNKSETEFGATCLHGPLECAGNVHELCAAKHTPRSHWWPFVQCLNYQGRDAIGYEDVGQKCAKATGIEWEESGLRECIQEGEGLDLFHKSIERTNDLNITKSCTVIISGEQRCIRDGTWYDCEEGHAVGDFVRVINREYEKLNSQGLEFDHNGHQATFGITNAGSGDV